jgi:hypothetical protein
MRSGCLEEVKVLAVVIMVLQQRGCETTTMVCFVSYSRTNTLLLGHAQDRFTVSFRDMVEFNNIISFYFFFTTSLI